MPYLSGLPHYSRAPARPGQHAKGDRGELGAGFVMEADREALALFDALEPSAGGVEALDAGEPELSRAPVSIGVEQVSTEGAGRQGAGRLDHLGVVLTHGR